jgi:hypothetical protein
MKRLAILFLFLLLQFDVVALEKATKGQLLEAFNGKYVVVNLKRSPVCFKGQIDSIDYQKCGKPTDVWIRESGTLCVEFKNSDKCAKVRMLEGDGYAWGSQLRPIRIFETKKSMLRNAKKRPKSKRSSNKKIILSCNGNTIEFPAGSNRSSDFETYWKDITIQGNKLIIPEYGEYQGSGRRWTMTDGWARINKNSGKLTATIMYPGGKYISKQLQADCTKNNKLY